MQNVLSQVEMAPFEFEGGEQSDGVSALWVCLAHCAISLCLTVALSVCVCVRHTACVSLSHWLSLCDVSVRIVLGVEWLLQVLSGY